MGATTTRIKTTLVKVLESRRHFREGWVHVCNGLDPVRDGGMVPSILGMTGALAARASEPVSIVTPTPSRLDGTPVPAGLSIRGPETHLESVVRGAEVVHLHGLWQGHTRRGSSQARKSGIPYLITAHGMADPWALKQKALKKALYTAFIEGKNLRRASCLHALTRPEIGHLRALAPRTPICLVPNGVNLAPFDDLPDRNELEREYPELRDKFIVLFFGRIHVKKGLDLLADALATVSRGMPELHVLLAGTDDGALGPLRSKCEALGVAHHLTWVGHVSGEMARRVWGAADAFVLPSYSEGFSMAVLEALASRLPALITTSCHFPELASIGGAITVEPTTQSVTAGLDQLVRLSAAERAELGRRGRALVERQYTWEQQARRLAEVYTWLSRGGAAPEAVVEPR